MNVYEEGIRKESEYEEKSRVGFEVGRVGRVKVSPSELASYNLYKTLEKYPEFTKEARSSIQNEFANFPGLETINLEVFSSVLTFLKSHETPKAEDFKDENIIEYFSRLLPTREISAEERKRLVIKLKAMFLKYIVAIFSYRESFKVPEGEEDEEIENNEEQYEDE
jgi:hypothetical protein